MDIEKLLKELMVLQEGHFLLNSGLHSKYYFQKFRILENPDATSLLCKIIVEKYAGENIEWVIGPTTGGIIIAFEVARQLGVHSGFAEEREGKRVVGRGFDIMGKRVLLVDDVLTTGRSIVETLEAIRQKGGEVVGVAVLIDRSVEELSFDPFSVYKKGVENFDPQKCPLCKSGIQLQKLGGV
ncbi:MAG: orotate phosphoribosyltransferase [candidate division WOR-3 bacterium]|nr:MAG: orotate phosphoribosyltransferase [candidate division WOR-3 bacterium]